jgi:hypothetical protein
MVQKLVLFIVVISVLAAGCISLAPGQGTIQFLSSPAGAQVYLDNMYQGTTPTTVAGISPGNHTLEYRSAGYESWHSVITVSPGLTTYIATLLPNAALLPGAGQPSPGTEAVATPATTAPVLLTVTVARNPMIIGASQSFTGTGNPGENVVITLSGPGKYTTGVVFKTTVGTDGRWGYTWNPGTSVLSGTYTVVVTDTQKTSSARDEFTVIGGGMVSVTTNMYSYSRGSTVLFSGQCTTGSQHVMLTLYGPGLYASGVNLGTQSINADNSWSSPFLISQSMPIGTYSISVTDEQRTSSASAGFTILQ